VSAQTPLMVRGAPLAAWSSPLKLPRGDVIGSDVSTGLSGSASSELTNHQIVAEDSKIQRRQRHTSRCVQPVAMIETLK
jgi:hypothetical protein